MQNRLTRLPKSLAILTCLAACVQFPALDGTVTEADRTAPYPALIPLAPLIARAGGLDQPVIQSGPLDARIARLNARAAALRGAIIEPATRARMQAGVDTAALAG